MPEPVQRLGEQDVVFVQLRISGARHQRDVVSQVVHWISSGTMHWVFEAG